MAESAAIILAAGKSTRMLSDLPKVLHEVCGRPMLAYVLDACRMAGVDRLLVVVGYGREMVMDTFADQTGITWIHQAEQHGTGHAVMCCRDALADFQGSLAVVAGDMPLVQRTMVARLIEYRDVSGDAACLATTIMEEPNGYGRIVRDDEGNLRAIVEDRDCTPEQREIREVNPSYYCFDARRLFGALDQVAPTNAKGEYYLTDAIHILRETGGRVAVAETVPAEEAMGVNSRVDLAMVNRLMQDRIQCACMHEGVTIVDPDNTWIESDVVIGRDSVVYPFSVVMTGARVGQRCRIGPMAVVARGETVEDDMIVAPSVRTGAAWR